MNFPHALKKFIPGLGKSVLVQKDELNLVTLSGTITSASLAQNESASLTVSHADLGLNTLPALTLNTTNSTAVLVDTRITTTGFSVTVTNTKATAQTVSLNWTRTGIQ